MLGWHEYIVEWFRITIKTKSNMFSNTFARICFSLTYFSKTIQFNMQNSKFQNCFSCRYLSHVKKKQGVISLFIYSRQRQPGRVQCSLHSLREGFILAMANSSLHRLSSSTRHSSLHRRRGRGGVCSHGGNALWQSAGIAYWLHCSDIGPEGPIRVAATEIIVQ